MLLSLSGHRHSYDLIGPEQAPVVCLAHSLSSDGGMWAEQLPPLLAAGFRVLRSDIRGHGGTEPLSGDYTMEAMADDLARLLEALDIPKVHLVGLSIGGMIGQAFAIRHGGKLLSQMWCDTLPAAAANAKEVWAPRIEIVRKANSLEPIADVTMERWFTPAFKPRDPKRWRQIRDTIAATTPQGYIGCAAALQRFDFVPKLPAIRLPTLVVCGDGDPGTPPADNKRLASLVPGARYEEIAQAQHFPNVERAEVFNKIMLEWLAARR